MGAGRRKFTKEFKEEPRSGGSELGVSLAEVARACEVNANVLHRWRREFCRTPARRLPGNGQRRTDESQVAELERKVGRQALEIDFLQRCLQHVEEQRKLQAYGNPQRLPEARRRSELADRACRLNGM